MTILMDKFDPNIGKADNHIIPICINGTNIIKPLVQNYINMIHYPTRTIYYITDNINPDVYHNPLYSRPNNNRSIKNINLPSLQCCELLV